MATRNIGDLAVNVLAKTDGFAASMAKTKKLVKETTDQVEKSQKTLAEQAKTIDAAFEHEETQKAIARRIRSMRRQAVAERVEQNVNLAIYGSSKSPAEVAAESERVIERARRSSEMMRSMYVQVEASQVNVARMQNTFSKLFGNSKLNNLGSGLGFGGGIIATVAAVHGLVRALGSMAETLEKVQSGTLSWRSSVKELINSLPYAQEGRAIGNLVAGMRPDVKNQTRAWAAWENRRRVLEWASRTMGQIDMDFGPVRRLSEWSTENGEIISKYQNGIRRARDAANIFKAEENWTQLGRANEWISELTKRQSQDIKQVNLKHYQDAIAAAVDNVQWVISLKSAEIQSSNRYRRLSQFFSQLRTAQETQDAVDATLDSFFAPIDELRNRKADNNPKTFSEYTRPELLMGAAAQASMVALRGSSREELEKRAAESAKATADATAAMRDMMLKSPKVTIFRMD